MVKIDEKFSEIRSEMGQSLDSLRREILDCPELLEEPTVALQKSAEVDNNSPERSETQGGQSVEQSAQDDIDSIVH